MTGGQFRVGCPRWRIAVVAVVLVCTGCGGEAEQPEQPRQTEQNTAPEPVGVEEPALEVMLLQYRLDQAPRRIQVAVTNSGDAPIEITSVALEAPGYASLPPTPKHAEIAPAARVDLPVVLGEARCAEGTDQSAGQAVVLARVRAEDGAERDVEVALSSPDEVLDRLLTRECDQLTLARALSVTFGPTWTPAELDGQRTLHGSLAVQRLDSAEPLTVSGTQGNVIFSMKPLAETRSPLLVLAPGQSRADIPIEITASRCDPHALADSKRTFFFPLWAAVGDGEELATFITVDDAARARLDELIRTGCGV